MYLSIISLYDNGVSLSLIRKFCNNNMIIWLYIPHVTSIVERLPGSFSIELTKVPVGRAPNK